MASEIKRTQLYIDGRFVNSVRGKLIPVVNPATETVFAQVSAANEEDVNIAVSSAKKAFDREGPSAWSTLSGAERAKYLRKISKKVQEKKEYLARLEATDCGKPYREALWDMDDVAYCFDYYAELAERLDVRQNDPIKLPDERFLTVVQYAPVGVVAAIVPWNYPLLMATWKVAPALAAGCTVVLKPSELTPLSALELAAIVDEIQLPPGVLNVLPGYGEEAGVPLSRHPNIDKIAFTGSVPTGSRVMSAAAEGIKKISLELGGKSPLVIFPDVDITEAVEWAMFGCFWTNGQICSATSRLLLHEAIAEKVLEKLVIETNNIFVGDPFTDRDPSMGPLVSETQYKKVLHYIEQAKAEGATLICGGSRPVGIDRGYYIRPTIFSHVTEKMTIWKEEIFGPVLAVMTFSTEEEAIRLANDTSYGLGAAIMSRDEKLCDRFVKAFRAGIVWVNCSQPCFCNAPWGGMKKSGLGRELGQWGLDNYLEVKQVTYYQVKEPGKWGWYVKAKM